ncbi:MAG: Ig-like domain-containing protein [Pseudomonadota bacterium]
MTYCPPNHDLQTYEFTALTGYAILDPGDTELGCGDSFSMPVSADACVAVTDNDGTLSGDAWCNEYGDDYSFQIADITVDGALVHEGERVYAEEVYSLYDEHGNCYWLVEIEVVGSANGDGDDFYAFIGSVPPAGTELTVASRHNVTSNWIEFRDLSAGLKWDLDTEGKVTIEAEDMALWGYKVDDVHASSGGEVIRLKKGMGQAAVTFGAEDGTYDIELAYIDENDGEGTIEVWLNHTLLQVVELDQNNNGNGGDWSSISTIKIEDVDLVAGDEIVLKGTRDAWEFARIDALTFCLHENEPPVALNDLGETDEDTLYTQDLLANDSDPDGDPLTLVSAGGLAPGSPITVTSENGRTTTVFVSAAGILSLDPTVDFNDLPLGATDSVTISYEITDGEFTATAEATVIINGLNDAPVAVDDFYQVSESAPAVLDILTNDFDPDGDTFTFTVLTQPIEGEVTVDDNGDVIFNPGEAFATLSEGQTATVTFDYEIFDGQLTDQATVTVQVQGEGVTDPMPMRMTELATTPGGDFTVQTEAPKKTTDGTADFSFSVSLGDFETEVYNIYYVIDVSGSTAETAGFGDVDTVLEAEIAALQGLTETFVDFGIPDGNLTITVLPFNSRAAPTEPVEIFNEETEEFDLTSFPIETFGDNELLSSVDINASLGALEPGGETSYLSAIFAAAGTAQQLDPFNQENNIFYFVSDGDPFPITPNTELQIDQFSSLFLHPRGDVHAIAVGDTIDTQYIDGVDNTDGVALVQNSEELAAAVLENSHDAGAIVSASLEVFNDAGTLVDTLVFTGADFADTPLGFRLDVENVPGFDPLVGQTNTAVMTVALDGDLDGTVDETLTQTLTIDGVLPVSFDF